MPPRGHHRRRRGKYALAWGLGYFLVIQATVTCLLETCCPELRDFEAACKVRRLRERMAQNPARPHVLILGSSRIAFGLRPDVIIDSTPPGETRPFVYNYGHSGAGPIQELIQLRRLLHERVRPDWIFLEIHPALLHQEGSGEDTWISAGRLGFSDMLVLGRYVDRPAEQWRQWLEARTNPLQFNRYWIMNKFARTWQPWSARDAFENGLDDNGWVPLELESVSPSEYRQRVAHAYKEYGPFLRDFRVSPRPERALRETLKLCRANGIGVLLLTMPEGHDFQSWYTSAALTEIDAFLNRLCHDYGVSWVDARSWMPDASFMDSHHLLPAASRRFTERIAREVWRPLAQRGYEPPPRASGRRRPGGKARTRQGRDVSSVGRMANPSDGRCLGP